jgi:uncharacterized RDD family membrane protein YckC
MESVVIDNEFKVAWYIRLANWIIDIIAIYVLIFLFAFLGFALVALFGITGMSEWLGSLTDADYQVVFIIIMTIYYIGMEATLQRTVGKYCTGTMVVSENGEKPSVKSVTGRSLCRIFGIEAFSFLGAYPRGWHDSASGTYVVNAKKYKEALRLKNSFEEIGAEQGI